MAFRKREELTYVDGDVNMCTKWDGNLKFWRHFFKSHKCPPKGSTGYE